MGETAKVLKHEEAKFFVDSRNAWFSKDLKYNAECRFDCEKGHNKRTGKYAVI